MKQNRNIQISVIITAYNLERYIGESIESVLKQTHTPDEIIVIDDGSTDKTADVVKKFGNQVIYHHQKNGGASSARNAGIKNVSGRLIAFNDGDDLWLPEKLEKQMKLFDDDPELEMAFCYVQNFYSPELTEEQCRKWQAPTGPVKGHLPSAFIVKKKSLSRVGLFNTDIVIGDFMDWYSRAKEMKLRESMLEDVLVRRRIHGNNLTIREKQSQSDYLKVIRASLKRKRDQQK